MDHVQHHHVIDCTWLIQTKYRAQVTVSDHRGNRISKLEPRVRVVSGGGLCLHHEGLVITVAHLVPENGVVIVRHAREIDFRRAKVVRCFPQLDLALIWVEKIEPNEQFRCMRLDESLDFSVDIGVSAFSYSHHDRRAYSFMSGEISYPFSRGVPSPSLDDRRNFDTWTGPKYETHEDAFAQNLPYRTLGHITEISDGWRDLHPRLPLIQVHGLGVLPDASGCPLFRSSDGSVLGLIWLIKSNYEYIIPVTLLYRVVFSTTTYNDITRPDISFEVNNDKQKMEKGKTSSGMKKALPHKDRGGGHRGGKKRQHVSEEAVDVMDNGINQYNTDQPPRYVNNTHLSSTVGRLNLDWTDPDRWAEKENEASERGMYLADSEVLDNLRSLAKSCLPARSIVMECISSRKDVDPSGEIMVLSRFCPWKLHLFELEEEMKVDHSIKYVLYQDDRSKHWRVQAVVVAPDRFEIRKPLPEPWRGLRDDDLSKQSGIPGGVFVHMSGFIGRNQTYEGALAMARAALKF